MSERYQTALLFGCPGAGKGTQGELLGRVPGFYHMSTGDMFRSLDRESNIGRLFFDHSSKGELVPDEVTIDMWSKYMYSQVVQGKFNPQREMLILDGIPRTAAQAAIIEQHVEVLAIVHLVATDKEAMIQRLSRRAERQGRIDDAKVEVVRNRLDVYARETKPVLLHYSTDVIHEVNAQGTPALVLKGVLDVLAPIQAKLGNVLT